GACEVCCQHPQVLHRVQALRPVTGRARRDAEGHAKTGRWNEMTRIPLVWLHGHIQDVFNKHNLQIVSADCAATVLLYDGHQESGGRGEGPLVFDTGAPPEELIVAKSNYHLSVKE